MSSTRRLWRAENTILTTQLILTIGRARHAVSNVDEASRLYQQLRDASGLGASEWPSGKLSNGYTISYNGRVWDGEKLVSEAVSNERGTRP